VTGSSEVVVVGAGQAGLAVSHELTQCGVPHVVLEQGRVGETWRGRWDSFCLVTPNWSVQLPDYSYNGGDPDGFMPRDEIVAMLERYAASFAAPVREGVAVTALRPDIGGFLLETSDGAIEAETVVLATGAYQRPHRPSGAAALPPDLPQIDVKDYRNPDVLPPGAVLVVGSGQSGCQIAEELCEAGRDVVLACGRASWGPRRLGGRDLFWWLVESGALDETVADLPGGAADRLLALVLATGHNGGHDINYRTLQKLGITLVGHFRGADGHRARFAPDLAQTVAWSDERHAKLMDQFRKLAAERGIAVEVPQSEPFNASTPEEVDLTNFAAVVVTSGFRPDYESWVECPGGFDEYGFPLQADGASDAAPGLYFIGVHFLRARKSSLLIGVGEDAAIVAHRIAAKRSAV
jgi:putative flavoprotein involved in K+ transport